MEIQRYGDDHLEIILDAEAADQQKKEIAALDQVIRSWKEKCTTAESCSVHLSPDEPEELVNEAKAAVKSLHQTFGEAVDIIHVDKIIT